MTEQDIRALAARIATEFRPQRIILFGSRAYGTPRDDSDVDLLVIMPLLVPNLAQAAEILARVHPRTFPIDLVVNSPEEAAWRYEGGDPLVREAFDGGRVLYEAAA